MKKEECPKFFSFDIVNKIITIISLIALFGFWNELDDLEKIKYIIVPFIIITLILNLIKYYINVKKVYKKYEELYNNNQALAQNYSQNVQKLKNEQQYNDFLRDFSKRTADLFMIYNDLSDNEQNEVRQVIISNYIDGMKGISDKNEK